LAEQESVRELSRWHFPYVLPVWTMRSLLLEAIIIGIANEKKRSFLALFPRPLGFLKGLKQYESVL
jgi:hypothetical protein